MKGGDFYKSAVRALCGCAVLALNSQAAWAVSALDSLPADAVTFKPALTQLAMPQAALPVQLPTGPSLFATSVQSPAPNLIGVLGRSAANERLSLFIAEGKVLSGDVYATGAHYVLGEWSHSLYWVRDFELGGRYSPDSLVDDVALPAASTSALQPAPKDAAGADGKFAVDVLVLYTPLYQERMAGTDLAAEAQRLIFLANSYFDNSSIPVRYRLAGLNSYSGASEHDNFATNQQALSGDPGVRQLRDSVSADLVLLLRTNDYDEGECGLSVLFNGGELSDPPANVDPERDAFVVLGAAPDANGLACPQMEHVFAHELGHAMGGGHQVLIPNIGTPYVVDASTSWKPYAHAWTCGIAGQAATDHVGATYYSMMTGNVGLVGNPAFYVVGWPRGDFFSSPALSLDGIPCGYNPTESAPGADNARSITEAAPYVAAYRAAGSRTLPASRDVLRAGALDLGTAFTMLMCSLLRRRRAVPKK